MVALSPKLPDEYQVRYTDTPEGRLRSRVLGTRREQTPPVVSLMGLGVSDYQLPALGVLAEWTQTHLVDLPGVGGSGPATRPLDVPGYAGAVSAWLDAAELPPVVLIGNSCSTQIAARVAIARPRRVRALVLASPTVDPKARSWPRVLFFWRWDARYPMPGLPGQNAPEWVRAGFRQLSHLVTVHLQDRLEDVVGQVTCPTLVLRGEHDKLSTESWARRLATLAPDGRFASMPGPHTFVWTHPAAWSDPIRDLGASGFRS